VIRLRQRHSAVPLLRSLGHFVVNLSTNIPPLRGLGKPLIPTLPKGKREKEKSALTCCDQ
jgi:hypothetical protein